MRVLCTRRWQLLLFFVSITIFAVSSLRTTAAINVQAVQKPVSSEVERRAAARQKTSAFLSDPNNQEKPVQVLISFQQGLRLPVALAQLKKLAPKAKLLVVTSYIYDEIGDRHTFGVLIREGENPEAKVNQYIHGLVQQTRDRAIVLLRCHGHPNANDQQGQVVQESEIICPAPAEELKPSLIAHTRLDPGQALVAGVVVEAAAPTVEQFLANGDAIAAVEIVHDDRIFVSPITPSRGGS